MHWTQKGLSVNNGAKGRKCFSGSDIIEMDERRRDVIAHVIRQG